MKECNCTISHNSKLLIQNYSGTLSLKTEKKSSLRTVTKHCLMEAFPLSICFLFRGREKTDIFLKCNKLTVYKTIHKNQLMNNIGQCMCKNSTGRIPK